MAITDADLKCRLQIWNWNIETDFKCGLQLWIWNTEMDFKCSLTHVWRQSCHHTETSQLIWSTNQLTGFYRMITLAFNELMLIWLNKTGSLYWSRVNIKERLTILGFYTFSITFGEIFEWLTTCFECCLSSSAQIIYLSRTHFQHLTWISLWQ